MDVVATGLDNPRGVVVAPGGAVLVAEAGRGGPGPCIPGAQGFQFCLGATGAITAVWQGQQRRIVTGLPSFGRLPNDPEVFGPHDIALTSSGVLVTIGYGAQPVRRPELGPGGALLGQVIRLGPAAATSASSSRAG